MILIKFINIYLNENLCIIKFYSVKLFLEFGFEQIAIDYKKNK